MTIVNDEESKIIGDDITKIAVKMKALRRTIQLRLTGEWKEYVNQKPRMLHQLNQ